MDTRAKEAIFGRRDLEQSPQPGRALPTLESGCVRIATAKDLLFIDKLQKKFASCVGFLPRLAVETLTEAGHVRIATENDEPAGYLLSRRHLRWQPQMRSITQACVQMDAQRRHHGLALLSLIEAEARTDGVIALQACCRQGLDANEFWRIAGFFPIVHMTPQVARKKEIICWRKPLRKMMPAWFAMPPQQAGHHAAKPTSNRNHARTQDAISYADRYLS